MHSHLHPKIPLQAIAHLISNCLCFVQLCGSHKDLLAGGRDPEVSEPPMMQETASMHEPYLLLWRHGNILKKVMKKLSDFIYIKRSLMPHGSLMLGEGWARLLFQRRQTERSGRTIPAASSFPGFMEQTQPAATPGSLGSTRTRYHSQAGNGSGEELG